MAEYADSPLHEAPGIRFAVAPTLAKRQTLRAHSQNLQVVENPNPQQSQLEPTWSGIGFALN